MILIWILAHPVQNHIKDTLPVYIIIIILIILFLLIVILFLLIVIIFIFIVFIEPYVFSYKYYFYWVSLALFQGAVEFVVSYLTYSYSYDILSHSGKQTGCEILGIMIISINIWGNLLISSRIYIYIYLYYIIILVTVRKWNICIFFLIFISIPFYYIVLYIAASLEGEPRRTMDSLLAIPTFWFSSIVGVSMGFLIRVYLLLLLYFV